MYSKEESSSSKEDDSDDSPREILFMDFVEDEDLEEKDKCSSFIEEESLEE